MSLYERNSYNRQKRIDYPDPATGQPDLGDYVEYTFDLNGAVTQLRQRDGTTIGFGYDALGRKTTETTALGTVYSDYDAAGRRIQLTWPDGFNVQYDYDVTGELVDMREYGQGGHIEDFAYDNLGRRTSRSAFQAGALSRASYSAGVPQNTASDASISR